ncbi:MAG: hypothetical protein QM783_11785 [Phycisphaerales bacterium]
MTFFGTAPENAFPMGFTRDTGVVVGDYVATLPDAVAWINGGAEAALTGPFAGFVTGGRSALACSADGSVVVGKADTADGNHAFRWTAAQGYQDLGVFPGGTLSVAWDVSPDGAVIVGSSTDGTGAQRPFRWTAAGGMVQIATPSNVVGAIAYGVSADGATIVGTCWTSSSSTISPSPNAFLWRQQSGFVVLPSYLLGLGVMTNFGLMDAQAVSDDGQVIVGNGSYRAAGVDYYQGYMVRLAGAPPLCPADLARRAGKSAMTGR